MPLSTDELLTMRSQLRELQKQVDLLEGQLVSLRSRYEKRFGKPPRVCEKCGTRTLGKGDKCGMCGGTIGQGY